MISAIGRWFLFVLRRLGRAVFFLGQVLGSMGVLFQRPGLVIVQVYSVGVLTLLIILVAGLFVGMVLGLQGYYHSGKFQRRIQNSEW